MQMWIPCCEIFSRQKIDSLYPPRNHFALPSFHTCLLVDKFDLF